PSSPRRGPWRGRGHGGAKRGRRLLRKRDRCSSACLARPFEGGNADALCKLGQGIGHFGRDGGIRCDLRGFASQTLGASAHEGGENRTLDVAAGEIVHGPGNRRVVSPSGSTVAALRTWAEGRAR